MAVDHQVEEVEVAAAEGAQAKPICLLCLHGTLRPVTSSEVWDEETAATYDDDDAASQFAPDVLVPTVDYLERLAEGGPALEFAVGTGRVGIPLTARGVPVTGSGEAARQRYSSKVT